jgi:hypothetical protein
MCKWNSNINILIVIDVAIIVKHTIMPFMEKRGHIWYSQAVLRWQYDARVLHAEWLRLKHTLRICDIISFSLQQLLHEQYLTLRYKYTAYLFFLENIYVEFMA